MKIPEHVAIILDGNRRYAKKKGLNPTEGHKAGADNVSKLVDWAIELGIKELTLYTFSTENFNRTKKEKAILFNLFRKKFKELKDSRDDIEVNVVGKFSRFPKDVQKILNDIASEQIPTEVERTFDENWKVFSKALPKLERYILWERIITLFIIYYSKKRCS